MDNNSLAASVIRSVNSRGSAITAADQSLVDLALRYAQRIDAGIESGGQEATKALYLGPHLLKALEALGCSPASRTGGIIAEQPSADGVTGPGSKLVALKRRRGEGGGA